MVIKLVKNEIRETYRSFTPIFIMTLVGAVLTALIGFRMRALASGGDITDITGIFLGLGIFAIYGLLLASGIMTLMALVRIGYHSLYQRNGYRLFTYPATSFELYVSKIIVISFWSVVTSFVIGGLFFISILIAASDYNVFGILGEVFNSLGRFLFGDGNFLGVMLMFINTVISSLVAVALLLFAGSVGNSSLIRSKRGFLTFVIFFGVNFLMSIINGIVTPMDSVTMYNSVMASSGVLNNSSQLIVILRDLIYLILLTVGTLWFWDNKLEIL